MTETAKNGVFLDTKTNQVVDHEPEEGVQLVAPGDEIDDAARKRIENAKRAAAGDDDQTSAVSDETDAKAKTVTAPKRGS